jgi:hypothetical protein
MILNKILLSFYKLYIQFWHDLGFDGFFDFLAITFYNHSAKSFFIQITVASATALSFSSFVEQWIYNPASAVWLIVFMVLTDTLLGAFVAIKQNEAFNLAKFTRMAPILISHLVVMSVSWHMSQIDNTIFSWLPQAVFAFFSGRNLMGIVRNMVILKWLNGNFVQFLIDRVKPDLMDAMKPEKVKSEKTN